METLSARLLLGRQSEATQVYMHGNVKHGDYLRTLGGAMTALCKSIASAVQPE